jgi:hypothetical protein
MFKSFLALALLIASTAISSQAAPILIGVFSGNDHKADVEDALYLATGVAYDLTLYDKSDGGPVLTTITASKDNKSGTWDVIDDSVKIAFVTVKASNNYAIYQYSPAENFGNWTTSGILNGGGKQPGLSHLSFWTVPESENPDAPVPEPSTVLMLGSAAALLIGVRKYARK